MAPTSTLIKYVLSVLLSPVCVCGSVGRCSSALCVLSLLLYRLNLRGTLGSIFLTLSTHRPSSPKKMRLERAEALQIVCERWKLPESGENCPQKIFRSQLDSERVKLTVIGTAPIATLPCTSFPDNYFASCLLRYIVRCQDIRDSVPCEYIWNLWKC